MEQYAKTFQIQFPKSYFVDRTTAKNMIKDDLKSREEVLLVTVWFQTTSVCCSLTRLFLISSYSKSFFNHNQYFTLIHSYTSNKAIYCSVYQLIIFIFYIKIRFLSALEPKLCTTLRWLYAKRRTITGMPDLPRHCQTSNISMFQRTPVVFKVSQQNPPMSNLSSIIR